MEDHPIYCQRCNKKINPKETVWLELSNTDCNYYVEIPKNHISQGGFSFGAACSRRQLLETVKKIKSCGKNVDQ